MPEPNVRKPNRSACGFQQRFNGKPWCKFSVPCPRAKAHFVECPIGEIARALYARQRADREPGKE